jgi:DNA-directed RNA polymerase specialized sigma24 family protein
LQLVVRARRGELDAFGALVEWYQRLAIRAASMVSRRETVAEEVAKKALLKANSALATDPNAFRAWPLRIVVNHIKAALRPGALADRATADSPAAQIAPSAEPTMLASERRTALMRHGRAG